MLSKACTALVVVPLLVYALSLVVSVLSFAALALKLSGTPYAAIGTWHTGAWLAVQGTLLLNLLVASLWYAPVAAFLLLVSAWAPPKSLRSWATGSPLISKPSGRRAREPRRRIPLRRWR